MTYPRNLYRPAGPSPEDGREMVTVSNHIEERGYIDAGYTPGESIDPLDHDKNGEKGGSISGGSGDEVKILRAEYKRVTGKSPFNGWTAAQLSEKIAAA